MFVLANAKDQKLNDQHEIQQLNELHYQIDTFEKISL